LLFSNSKKLKFFAIFTSLFLIVSLSAGIIFVKPIRDRVATLRLGFNKAGHRRTNWKEAMSIIKDHPILGTGPNTYAYIAPNYKLRKGGGIYPHNSFLHMGAELGLLGFAAFLWVLCKFFYLGIIGLRRNQNFLLLGTMAGLFAFLVHSFFDNNIFVLQLASLFWFMLGVSSVLIKKEVLWQKL